MKKNILSLIFLFIGSTTMIQAQPLNVVDFGNSSYTLLGEKGCIDDLGNYVMGGRKNFNSNDWVHLAMFNANYQPQWSYYLNKTGYIASKIKQTKDKNYVALYSSGISAIIFKFSVNGTILWYKQFNNVAEWDDFYEDSNNDLYVCGNMLDKNIVMKMNSAGTVVWSYQFISDQGANYYFGRNIQEVSDGNLVIAGAASIVSNSLGAHIVVIKINKQGQLIWSKIHKGPGKSIMAVAMAESDIDGSLVAIGYTGNMMDANSFDGFMLKMDSAGNHITNKTVAFNYWDYFYDICLMGNGQMMAIGMSKPVQVCGGNLFYTRFDQVGDTVLTRVYGTPSGNGANFNNIQKRNQDYYSFGLGSLWANIASGYEYQMVRVDSMAMGPCKLYAQQFTVQTLNVTTLGSVSRTNFTPAIVTEYQITKDTLYAVNACSGQPLELKEIKRAVNISLYPNPSRDNLYVQCSERIQQLKVYDLNGRVLMQQTCQMPAWILPVRNLKNGIYVIRLEMENGEVASRQFVKE